MKTADQVLQELPFRWGVQGKIFIIGGLGYLFDAWDITMAGYLIPLLAKSEWGLSSTQLGLFGTIGLLGMAVGALGWGTIADMIGRKRAFTYTLLVFSIFTILGALSPNYTWLLATRFIAGFGLGGCVPVDYSLVAEFMPKKVRGAVLTSMDGWWPIGATIGGFIAVWLLPYEDMLPFHNWRLLMMFMVLPAILVIWVRRSVPESALYLIRNGRKEEAREIVQTLINRTQATVGDWDVISTDTNTSKASFKNIFSQFKKVWKFNWKLTLTVWSILISNQFLYFGVITWLPQILVKQGYGEYTAFMFATSLTAVGIFGVLVSAWLVEVIGRKWVIMLCGLASAASMVTFTMWIDVPFQARLWILAYGFISQLVLPVLYTYATEVYPTLLRASGFGFASSASRVGAGFVPLILGSVLWPVFGLTNTFIFMGLLILISSIFMFLWGPETKGKSLDEIGAEPTASN
jgi:MFS transporter, putative metabolite:H+ symporter